MLKTLLLAPLLASLLQSTLAENTGLIEQVRELAKDLKTQSSEIENIRNRIPVLQAGTLGADSTNNKGIWTLTTGGDQECNIRVDFHPPYNRPPVVILGLTMLDATTVAVDQTNQSTDTSSTNWLTVVTPHPIRVSIAPVDIAPDHFYAHITKWGSDTIINGVRLSWLAFEQ